MVRTFFSYPRVILVAGFCATTWIEGVYYVLVLGLLAPSLEMQWGHIELLQFSAVVIAGTNILSWILALLVGLVTRSEQMLFHTHFDGMHGLITGFLVAYAQIMPEVRVPYIPKLTARDVPMLAVGLSNIPCILGYMAPFIQYQIAWLVSWVYLRFYQVGQAGQRGDASDAFAFVTWFPPFIHPVLGPVSQFVYKMASSWHLVPLQTGYMDLELSVQEPHAGGAREEAERRRTMALAALDARLADSASSKAPPTATSSQDEA